MKSRTVFGDVFWTMAGGALLGAVVSWLVSPLSFWYGWLAAAGLCWLSLFLMVSVWRWGGKSRQVGWMILLAFLLRLSAGLFLELALPIYGYDEKTQKAGYVFYDAYMRDTQAWEVAESGQPLWKAFSQEFATDQYGGLLSLSAVVYRLFSPDAHRPILIVILGALAAAGGVGFLWQTARLRWGSGAASLAGWMAVLYPESILLGSSQMREPFLIGLIAIAFWALIAWGKSGRIAHLVALFAGLLGITLFSSRIAAPVLVVLAGWYWFDNLSDRVPGRLRPLMWVLLGLAGAGVVYLTWGWLQTTSTYDVRLTWQGSGRLQKAISDLGNQWRWPFIAIYGITQPVLPAAIADPALPLWRTIAILRAAGWYLLAPLFAYSLFTVWKARPWREARSLTWLGVILAAWLVISSLRAGGDQWDNPRYRTIFLVWLVCLAGWSVQWALAHRDAWLWRWLLVEAIFVGFFTNWYISRYYNIWERLPFNTMLGWITGLSAAVLVGGWAWDRWRRSRGGRA